MPTPRSAKVVDEEACAWLARRDANKSRATRIAFQHWLTASEGHRVAFARAQAMWALLGITDDDVAASEAEEPIVASPLLTRRALVAGLGATLLMATGGAGLFLSSRSSATRLVTGLGEIQSFNMPDGTAVQLDTMTALDIDIGRRKARLLTGQIWIRLNADNNAPFVLQSPRLVLDAKTAEFCVDCNAADRVLVTQGSVVLHDQEYDQRTTIGPAMYAVRPDSSPLSVRRLNSDELSRSLAWRDGLIEMHGERVIEAVNAFNRYHKRKIVVLDSSLAEQSIVGRFDAEAPEDFASALITAFGAHAEFLTDEIRLTIM